MAQFQLVVDDRELKQHLKKMPKQIPFAMATALNEAAFEIRRHTVKSVWPSSVKPKARGFAGRAFRVLRANKTKLRSAVYADPGRVAPEGIEAIARLEHGQPHYPFKGKYLAVPTWHALTTKRGAVTKAAKAALKETNPHSFVKNMRGKGPAIWLRTPRGLKMLFVLKPNVSTPRSFPFGREAYRMARLTWPGSMIRATKKAIRTSRR